MFVLIGALAQATGVAPKFNARNMLRKAMKTVVAAQRFRLAMANARSVSCVYETTKLHEIMAGQSKIDKRKGGLSTAQMQELLEKYAPAWSSRWTRHDIERLY